MYDGGEESPLLSLGAPILDSCLLYFPDQGKTRICHLPPWAEDPLLKYGYLVKCLRLLDVRD